MALTQSAWEVKTVKKGSDKPLIYAKCTVAATTAENDAYTLKTPKELDVTKPWTLIVATSAASDAAAVPLDLWVGYDENFIITGDSTTVAATSGVNYKQITDDIGYAAASSACFFFDPYQAVADVVTIAAIATGYKVKIPIAPYYAFNLDGGSTLLAHTATYIILQ